MGYHFSLSQANNMRNLYKLGCDGGCRVKECSKKRCEVCDLFSERLLAEQQQRLRNRCCAQCSPLLELKRQEHEAYCAASERKVRARAMGFREVNQKDFCSDPVLDEIGWVIYLGSRTCSERAFRALNDAHALDGHPRSGVNAHSFSGVSVSSFHDGVLELIRKQRTAALLVPDLHPVQRALDKKPHYREIPSQTFELPNPKLYVARPAGSFGEQSVLFVLPALLPLVEEAYGGEVPFNEMVYVQNTADAAHQCYIFGEGYCVVNEMELGAFGMIPEKQLPHKNVTWRLYVHRPRRLQRLLNAA